MTLVIQILMASLGSLTFGILFRVQKKFLLYVVVGGALAWSMYLVCSHLGADVKTSVFLATCATSLFAEVFARILHCPVIVLQSPCLIPLIPGADLYYAMSEFVRANSLGVAHGPILLSEVAAIAFGVILVATLMKIFARRH